MGMFVHDNPEERVGTLYEESELNGGNCFGELPSFEVETHIKSCQNVKKESKKETKTEVEELINKKTKIESKILKLKEELEKLENEQIRIVEEKIVKEMSSKYKDKIIEMIECKIKAEQLFDDLANEAPADEIELCDKCNEMHSWYNCLELCPFAVVCGIIKDGEFYDIESWKTVLEILKNKF